MTSKQINDILLYKGFEEKKLDTGFNYTKKIEHIELVCYIEPDINVSFTTLYRWNDNEIKGAYDIPVKDLNMHGIDIDLLFKRAVKDMPRYIGTKESGVDVHAQVESVIDQIFN
ncbi:MAG TPA: hypothetical protein DIT04_03215 [Dysgonomonas sp.]|nr:hypothetical protein [Dysgonomonas sp.]